MRKCPAIPVRLEQHRCCISSICFYDKEECEYECGFTEKGCGCHNIKILCNAKPTPLSTPKPIPPPEVKVEPLPPRRNHRNDITRKQGVNHRRDRILYQATGSTKDKRSARERGFKRSVSAEEEYNKIHEENREYNWQKWNSRLKWFIKSRTRRKEDARVSTFKRDYAPEPR